MVKLLHRLIIVSAIISMMHCAPGQAFACFGARPMAMGGAFTGLADDAHAVYWNPAGLGLIKEGQCAYTGVSPGCRDNYNHDDFLAVVVPFTTKEDDFGTLGVWFANSGFDKPEYTENSIWHAFSYGKQFGEYLCIGISGKYERYRKKTATATDSDTLGTVSLGFLYKIDDLSFGLLIQDMNKAAMQVFDQTFRYIVNVRPGIAYQLDNKTTLTLDMYDAAGATKKHTPDLSQDLRFGIEHWKSKYIALRAGGYHLNSATENMKAITGGFGFKPQNKLFKKHDLSFDYAVIYWKTPPSGTGHYTHQAGIVFKY